MYKLLFVLLLSLSLAACRLPSGITASPSPTVGGAAQQQEQVLTLRGQVLFPRQVQATIKDDVAIAATVSLINTGSNRTEVSGVTDDQGRFSLIMPKAYRPDPATTYYLEAVKGLGENKPGHSAARVRTIMKYDGGWMSLSNTEPGDGIVVSTLTTAVAVGAALRKGTATPVDFDALIGKVSGQTYTPVPNLSQADVTVLTSLVAALIAADQDPVAGVTLDTGSNAFQQAASSSAPEVSTSSVSVAQVGGTVTLTGSGFDPTPGNNVVKINGAPVTVVSATPTSLTIQIPAGATSGQITVQVGSLIILGPVLSVMVKVESFSPSSGSAGATLTISGSGFDPSDLSNNIVVFAGGATASVQAVAATSLTVTVPAGAVSGPVTVNVLGSEGTSVVPFTVPVVLSSFSPTGGPVGASITLTGSGFSTTPASNSVTINGTAALVTAATATTLWVKVPAGATDGPFVVTVAGQTSSNSDTFDVSTGLRSNATIQTIAGITVPPAGRQANDWNIGTPDAMARDGSGNTYLAASSRIYKVTPAGVISLLAGAETAGYADGPALTAKFSWNLTEMVCDVAGNVYVSDSDNFCIRKIAPNGDVTTVAGVGGQMGNDPDGGLAVATKMHAIGLAVDGVGNLYIGSTGVGSGYAIRKVTASTGIVSTFKNTNSDMPLALLLDGGTLYAVVENQILAIALSDATTEVVAGMVGVGGYQDGPGTSAVFDSPRSIAKDAAGNLYVTEPYNDCVRKIDPAHNVTTYAGMKANPGYSGDGGLATSAQLNDPLAVMVDAAGDLLISDNPNQCIRKVTAATGKISTVYGTGGAPSGDGGPATKAQLGGVSRMVRDAAGNLYLSSGTRIRKIDALSGVLSTIAGNGVAANTGDGGPAAAAQVNLSSGMAFDAAGNLYVGTADGGIRKIDLAGNISLFVPAGSFLPVHMAFAHDGNLFVAGGMNPANSRIWKVTPQGAVSVFAGGGASTADGALATQATVARPQALAVDSLDQVYYSDYTLKRVRRIDTSGVVSTVAGNGGSTASGDGGPATAAGIGAVSGLALDDIGNMYLSTSALHVVRRVDPSGVISTVVGTGAPGFAGDGGSAQAALINTPMSLLLGAGGTSLYVYDSGNQRIRLVQ